MKHLLWILALTLALTGCSQKETTPAEETPLVQEETTDTEVKSLPTVEEADSDEAEVVVVEESAAEPEPQDEAIVLARADKTDATPRKWQFKEGQHYTRMVPTQPTVGGADQIEVAEVFMYSCPHCESLEPIINLWAETKDPNVRFVRIPAIFNNLAKLHAQLYYTEEVLARNGKLSDPAAFRKLVFEEYHRRGNRLSTNTAIQRLFARAGVSEDDFASTWNSFEVNQKLRVAADLGRRYNVDSVPMIIVNGKYKTGGSQAGSNAKLIDVIDELTAREGLR